MNWHYVDQGQQAGPVTDAQLWALHQQGAVTADTLVWHSGLDNWIPFREAKLEAPPAAPPPLATATAPLLNPNEPVCAECGKTFPIDETIRVGNVRVCAACKPVFLQKIAEGARINVAGELRYAGFWIRVGAKLIDGIIVGIPFFVIMFIMGVAMTPTAGGANRTEPSPVMPFMFMLVEFGMIFINLAYQIFFLGKYGATPGKMLCKLKVVTAEGERFGYARATGRTFAEMLSGMICYIGYFMVAFDAQKRGLHDHICNTRVVYKE